VAYTEIAMSRSIRDSREYQKVFNDIMRLFQDMSPKTWFLNAALMHGMTSSILRGTPEDYLSGPREFQIRLMQAYLNKHAAPISGQDWSILTLPELISEPVSESGWSTLTLSEPEPVSKPISEPGWSTLTISEPEPEQKLKANWSTLTI
jgi:hypothetical protein